MSITHAAIVPPEAQSMISGHGEVIGTYALATETISAGGFAADIATDQSLPAEPVQVDVYDVAGGKFKAQWVASTKKIIIYNLTDGSELTGSQTKTFTYSAKYLNS